MCFNIKKQITHFGFWKNVVYINIAYSIIIMPYEAKRSFPLTDVGTWQYSFAIAYILIAKLIWNISVKAVTYHFKQ